MSSDKVIGPAFPPTLRNDSEDSDIEEGFAGPALPPGYKRAEPSSSSDESEQEVTAKRAKTAAADRPAEVEKTRIQEDDGFFGPALPPGFKKQQSSPERPPVLGPALPPGFRREAYSNDDNNDGEDGESLPGPALPPGYKAEPSSSEGEDEYVIGPMPAKGPVEDSVALDIERRAQRMKEKLSRDESKRAESLMTLHTKKMKEKAKEKADEPVERRPFDRDADLQVPKYLSQQWAKATGRGEVGKIRICKKGNQGKPEVAFTLNEELTVIQGIENKTVAVPREHPFTMQLVGDKIALEGVVVQRAECRPAVSESYMRLKKLQIEESSKPARLSQQLDKAVTSNYKPVANHANNLEYERKKKEEGKRARAEKSQVLDMLFSAFEKHQYYNIKDLVDITKQPVSYLKEILRDIGIYNVKGTHKNTWELKPEYRHYQVEEKTEK
ncbi:General transcription factor IIF subunit 2 [Channa argus]|uniref:General transcription factor IIF subunit 2 n=1 Tax=Channa argus TaxID=215402 RepID=A0A6G1P968_CHAAH|nr:General transcription factor IIF subunit 2 [Channa argus]